MPTITANQKHCLTAFDVVSGDWMTGVVNRWRWIVVTMNHYIFYLRLTIPRVLRVLFWVTDLADLTSTQHAPSHVAHRRCRHDIYKVSNDFPNNKIAFANTQHTRGISINLQARTRALNINDQCCWLVLGLCATATAVLEPQNKIWSTHAQK